MMENRQETRKNLLNDPTFHKVIFARNQADLDNYKEKLFAVSNFHNDFEIEPHKKSPFQPNLCKNTLQDHNEIGLLTKKLENLEAKVLEKNSILSAFYETVEEEKARILKEETKLSNAIKFLNRNFEDLDLVFEKIEENKGFLNNFIDKTIIQRDNNNPRLSSEKDSSSPEFQRELNEEKKKFEAELLKKNQKIELLQAEILRLSSQKSKNEDQKFVVLQNQFMNLEKDYKKLIEENRAFQEKNAELQKIADLLRKKNSMMSDLNLSPRKTKASTSLFFKRK